MHVHPALPFLAQGAAMAIEDAYVLARCLALYGADYRTAFKRYEAARIGRTTRVVTGSADNLKRFHSQRLADELAGDRYILAEWTREKVAERYEWLFRYDALSVEI
jgi:salicylate hydroxylase